jgi:hypothetical protein
VGSNPATPTRKYGDLGAAGRQAGPKQWIITQRLERARRDLVTLVGRQRPITPWPQAWYFNDASHLPYPAEVCRGLNAV